MPIRYLSGLSVDSNVLVVDAANDRVGIGTASPGAKLTVFTGGASAISGTNDGLRLQVNSYNTLARNTIAWHQDGSNFNLGRFGLEWNSVAGQMNFVWRDVYNNGVGSTELMRLQGNGNVLINTTTDSGFKLDVNGTGRFSQNLTLNGLINNSVSTFSSIATFNGNISLGGNTTLFSNGSATFSSSVTALNYNSSIANKATLATASGALNVPYTTSNINEFQTIGFSYPSSVDNITRWGMALTATNFGAGLADLIFFTATTERLRIANSGAATFSSSVTASSLIKSGGTSAQYLMADGSVSTLTNPVTGTGTTNFVPKWTSASAIGNSTLQEVSGNLGLGVTPSAWQTDIKAIQIGDVGSNICANNGAYSGGNNVWLNNNSFQNSSIQDIYTRTATAAQYNIQGNTHIWRIAPFGTAGNVISFTQAMTLNAAGNLMLGTTVASSGFSRLSLVGGEPSGSGANTGIQLTFNSSTFGGGAITTINAAGGGLSFYTFTGNVGAEAYAERIRIAAGGNVLIGTTTDSGFKLDVNGTGRVSGNLQLVTTGGTRLTMSGTDNGIVLNDTTVTAAARNWGIFTSAIAEGDFVIQVGSSQGAAPSSNVLYLASTGAATFSSNVTANGSINGFQGATHNLLIDFSSESQVTTLTNTNLFFGTNAQRRMTITAAGLVGIGVTNPVTAKLEVFGGIPTLFTADSQAASATYGGSIFYRNTKNLDNGNGISFALNNASDTLSEYGYIGGLIETNTAGSNNGAIIFVPTLANARIERMRIASSGAIKFNAYGSGTFTGTPAFNLAVDSSGNIIETAGGVVDGSGTANFVTKWQDANTVTNSQVFDNGTNVGINNSTPKTKLDVNGTIGFGSKSMSMSDVFANALTVNMNPHNGCYVKITAFGDWSAHSTIAYLGEFFLQNGDGAYGEPGTIIRQVDNTPTDDIQAQIVDPAGSGVRDFIIQLKTTSASDTPFTAFLQFEVRGQYNSVS